MLMQKLLLQRLHAGVNRCKERVFCNVGKPRQLIVGTSDAGAKCRGKMLDKKSKKLEHATGRLVQRVPTDCPRAATFPARQAAAPPSRTCWGL